MCVCVSVEQFFLVFGTISDGKMLKKKNHFLKISVRFIVIRVGPKLYRSHYLNHFWNEQRQSGFDFCRGNIVGKF